MTRFVWFALMLGTAIASAQTATPAPVDPHTQQPASAQTSAACAKTITFAVAEGGQPVPAVPKFAAKWVGKGKHVENYSDMCLSQIPSSRTANYVVIFSTSSASFDGLTPIAHTYSSTSPLSGNGPSSSSYGGTWSYSYRATLPPETTSTTDFHRLDGVKNGLLLYTYNQQGHLISRYIVDGNHSRENRLEQVLADIHRDVAEKPAQKHIAAPLSVYYVNCDVDSPGPSSLVAAADPSAAVPEPKPASAPQPTPAPPPATLDLISHPTGADIYLDEKFIGRTPLTVTVIPGEHTVIMRKQDFSTWGRKIQATPGPRKLSAYLEQKFVTLPSAQPQNAESSTKPQTAQPQEPQSHSAQGQTTFARPK